MLLPFGQLDGLKAYFSPPIAFFGRNSIFGKYVKYACEELLKGSDLACRPIGRLDTVDMRENILKTRP